MNQCDWIIRGGRVIDPANGVDDELDLAISDGVIARVGRSLDVAAADRVYDAGGQLIVPGFIDLHAHCYDKGTPWADDIDHYNLGRGVTTTVDAGSSGCDTFDGFRTLAVERFRSRVLAFLNISRVGMSVTHADDGSEVTLLDRAEFINRQDCTDCIESNRDVLVGVVDHESRAPVAVTRLPAAADIDQVFVARLNLDLGVLATLDRAELLELQRYMGMAAEADL